MRKLSRILAMAVLVMAAIILPLGISTIIMAFKLGLFYDALNCLLMLCFFIAFSLYEFREIIAEYEWDLADAQAEEMHEPSEFGGEQH